MSHRSQRITPYLIVSNCSEALDYYQKYMSAKMLERKETEDGKIIHSSFELPNGAQFMMCDVCKEKKVVLKSFLEPLYVYYIALCN